MSENFYEVLRLIKQGCDMMERGIFNMEVAHALSEYGRFLILKGKPKEGLYATKKAKECLEKIVEKQTGGGTIWALEKYARENEKRYDILDRYYELLLLEAPYLFDSFMLYVEKERPLKERYYLPKKKQFAKFQLVESMQALEDDELDLLTISMPPGTGKCLGLDEKVLTPNGFVKMRDVKLGDCVVAGNGKKSRVIGVFPQEKKKKMYRLTFDDGSSVEASDDHLWKVQTRDDRRRYGGKNYRIVQTSDILKNYKIEGGKRLNYSIDYVPKITAFPERDLPIHPYVLGCLLGDGTLTSCLRFTKSDYEVVEKMNSFMKDEEFVRLRGSTKEHYCRAKDKSRNIRELQLRKDLRSLGLLGTKSDTKFIPKEYLYSSHEQRLWLLRGLLDTDGYAWESGIEYCSASEKLAKGVVELVHSLGGYASIKVKENGYRDSDRNFVKCKDSHVVVVQFSSNHESPFFLNRKAEKYKPKRTIWRRFIKNIEYVGEKECKCILINDPCHLFITNDYIITHNTTIEKFFAAWIIGRYPADYSLFFSHSADITDMFYRGVLDIITSDEYLWSEIFPDVKLQSTNAKNGSINVGRYKPFASLQTTSRGASNAGKVRANRYLYVDDLIASISEALNTAILDKIWNTYSVDARQRKLNEKVKEIHIATRWSVRDVIGRLKILYEGNGRSKFIAVPDIDEVTGESNFMYEYNGMDTKFFNDQELAMDDITYRCLYKSDPIEREGLLYHKDDIRRYLSLPLREPDAILGVCDVKNKGTDFMFLPCCYQYGEDYYLVDCVCDDSADYGMQYQKLTDLILRNNMQQVEFESNSGGDRVAFEVRTRIEEKGGRCNITEKPTETNKETRIIVNADWVKKHVLFRDESLYHRKDDYGVMMEWLFLYTTAGKNVHDDVPDGLANFALYVTRGSNVAKVEAITNPFRRYGGGIW